MKRYINKLKIFATHKSSVFIALVVPSTFIINACSDLSSVKNFADISQEASVQFENVEADLYQSCLRTARYDLAIKSPNELPNNKDAEAECTNKKRFSTEIAGYHKVLQNYMQVMSQLAADELVVYDKSLNALGSELAELPGVNLTQVSAVNEIVKFLSKALNDNYRRRKIKTVIRDTNSDIQIVLASVRRIVESNYEDITLENEQAALDGYYRSMTWQYQRDPLSVETLKEKWEIASKEIQSKRNAAQSYIEIIDRISASHQKLYENSTELTSTEVDKILLENVLALPPLVDNIRKAF